MVDNLIKNVGTNGDPRTSIASEATLKELLLTFKANSGLSDKQTKALTEFAQKYQPGGPVDKEADKKRKSIDDAARALEKSLKGMPGTFENFNDLLTRGAKKPAETLGDTFGKTASAIDSATAFMASKLKSRILITGLTTIGTLATIAGTALGALGGFLQDSLETFKDLSNYGGNFGNDLLALRKAAASGNLSLEEFSALVKENSQLFATIGTNVSEGAKVFADLSVKVRKFDNQRLKELGYTVGDVNDMLLDYLDVASKSSDVQYELYTNTDKVAASAAKFGTELNEVSSMTGISRKQLSKEIKEQAQRGEVQASLMNAFNNGIANADEKFRSLIMAVTPFGPTASKAAADLVAFGGAFRSEESRAILTFAPAFARSLNRYAKAVTSNVPGPEVGEAYEQMVDGLFKNEKMLIRLARNGNVQAAKILAENAHIFARYRNLQDPAERKRRMEQDKKEALQRQKMGQSLNKLDEVFRNVKSRILEVILNSGVMEKLVSAFDYVAEWLSGPEFNDAFQTFLKVLSDGVAWISDLFTESGRKIVYDQITNFFEGLLIGIREKLVSSPFYRMLTGDTAEKVAAADAANLAEKQRLAQVSNLRSLDIQEKLAQDNVNRLSKQKIFDKEAMVKAQKELDDIHARMAAAFEARDKAIEAETKARQKQAEVGPTDIGKKIDDTFTEVLTTLKSAADAFKSNIMPLFTEEGRQEFYQNVIDLFDGMFIRLRTAMEKTWWGKSLLAVMPEDKTARAREEQFALKAEEDNKKRQQANLSTIISNLENQLSAPNLSDAEKQSIALELENAQVQRELLKQEADVLKKKREDLKNAEDTAKEQRSLLLKQREDLQISLDEKKKAYDAKVSDLKGMLPGGIDFTQLLKNINDRTAEMKARVKASELTDVAKGLNLSEEDASTLRFLMKGKVGADLKNLAMDNSIADIQTSLTDINDKLKQIPGRREGGGTGKGGLFQLHPDEQVFPKWAVSAFNKILAVLSTVSDPREQTQEDLTAGLDLNKAMNSVSNAVLAPLKNIGGAFTNPFENIDITPITNIGNTISDTFKNLDINKLLASKPIIDLDSFKTGLMNNLSGVTDLVTNTITNISNNLKNALSNFDVSKITDIKLPLDLNLILPDLISKLNDKLTSTFERFKISDTFTNSIQYFKTIFDTASQTITSAGKNLNQIKFEDLQNVVVTWFDGIKIGLTNALNKDSDFTTSIKASVNNLISLMNDSFTNVYKDFETLNVSDTFMKSIDYIKSIFDSASKNIISASKVLDDIKFNELQDSLTNWFNGIKTGILTAGSKQYDFIEIQDTLTTWFNNIKTGILTAGSKQYNFNEIHDALTSWFNNIKTGLINDSNTKFDFDHIFNFDSLAKTLNDIMSLTIDSVINIYNGFEDIAEKLDNNNIGEILKSFESGLITAFGDLNQKVTNLTNGLDKFESLDSKNIITALTDTNNIEHQDQTTAIVNGLKDITDSLRIDRSTLINKEPDTTAVKTVPETSEFDLRSAANFSAPERAMFEDTKQSKTILQNLMENNEEFLNLFRQHLVYQEEMSRNISDLLDYYDRA